MWSKSYTIVTNDVPKEQRWQLFADVNRWPEWDRSVAYAKLEGPFATGNHFIFQPKGGSKLKLAIVEATEGKGFTDCTRFPLARMYGRHSFEDTADGLKVTTTVTVEGLLGPLWRRLVAQKIVDALPADMRAQVEAAKKR